MIIEDIFIEESFIEDYDDAPGQVCKKVDKLLNHLTEQADFPNSFNVHKAETSHVWIGYVTRKHLHWRILFEIDEYTNQLYLLRLVTHKRMDKILRELAKI